jgi:hypothetical protein
MIFRRTKKTITRQQQLSARPERREDAKLETSGDGGGKVTIPLRARRGWILRLPEGATKTFELDAMGLFVWDACDGKTSVQQIIRRLGKRYNLSLRESEVSTIAFLHMLAKKGLIGMDVRQLGNKSE